MNALHILGSVEFIGPGPIDFVIDVDNSGGIVEYFANFGTAINNSGLDRQGFRLITGSVFGANFVSQDDTLIPNLDGGLDWDFPDQGLTPSSVDFPNLAVFGAHELVLDGGLVSTANSATDVDFAGDFPDTGFGGSYQFTIRAEPIAVAALTPEPSTFALGLIGLLSLSLMRRRRRR